VISWLADAVIRTGSLVVSDRRWTAPLTAMAVGLGLFVGIAIGPASEFATGGGLILLEMPSEPAEEPEEPSGGGPSGGPGGGGAAPLPGSLAPLAAAPASYSPAGDGGGGGGGGDGGGGGSDSPRISGTVVHTNPVAGSYTLADSGGQLYAIHAGKLPAPGLRVKTGIRQLANGTYAQDGKRSRLGKAEGAGVSGTVSFVETVQGRSAYTLSVPGVSIRVRIPAGSAEPVPKLGAFATVEVGIEEPPDPAVPNPPESGQPPTGGCGRQQAPEPVKAEAALVQRAISVDGPPLDYSDLAGTVQAVCPSALVISSDDIREGASDVTLQVPSSFDLSKLEVDEPIVATATIDGNGGMALAGLGSDRGLKGADDEGRLQGDLKGG
jgi:hypothetical protein